MVKYMDTDKCDLPYKQTGKKSYNLLIRCAIGLCHNPSPLHDKSPGEIRDTGNIPQHTKGSLPQVQG